MSFSYVALQRMQRLAPDLRLVMLIEKARHWPMLKPVLEDGWLLGPGIYEPHQAPEVRPAPGPHPPRPARLDGQHPRAAGPVPVAGGARGDHRPAAPDGQLARRRAAGPSLAAWPRSHGPRLADEPPPTRAGADGRRVGPRQPCPCGSGKRYKACHGSAGGAYVARPFAGLAAERDLVALREFVSSATAPLRVGERTVRARHHAADGGTGDGARQRPGVARPPGAALVRRPVPRPGSGARGRRWPADEPGIVGLVDPPGPRRPAPGPGRRRAPGGDRPRRLRLVARRRRGAGRRHGRGARAGQRRRRSVGTADDRGRGVLDPHRAPRSTCAG